MKTTPIDTPRRDESLPNLVDFKRAWRSGAATADRAYAELWAWHGLVSRCNPLHELRLKATSAEAARDQCAARDRWATLDAADAVVRHASKPHV